MAIENQYIQTSLMAALSLFRGKEGGGLFINQSLTLCIDETLIKTATTSPNQTNQGVLYV